MLVSETLNKWLHQQLRSRGWTMNELARRSNLSSGFVSQVLSGKKEPGAKFYQGIAEALDMTAEGIERLDQEGVIPESRKNDPVYLELLGLAQRLSPADLKEVLDYAVYRFRKSKNLPP